MPTAAPMVTRPSKISMGSLMESMMRREFGRGVDVSDSLGHDDELVASEAGNDVADA